MLTRMPRSVRRPAILIPRKNPRKITHGLGRILQVSGDLGKLRFGSQRAVFGPRKERF
jgi:hypothetical protein